MPSGAKARARANIAAIDVLARLRQAGRLATVAEQRSLAAWSGWGAIPGVFDRRDESFTAERDQVRELLTREQYDHAQASVLNAHYTDPALAQTIWQALQRAGFTGGRVLEPGCGSGTFIGQAPDSAVMVGVENDDITAAVAAALYPSAQVRHEGFETTRVPEDSFVATVGNVPFGKFAVHDPAHNPQRHTIHNHFIIKALALTAPGGYVAVLTSRYTMDAMEDGARRDMADRADLVAAVRLPSKAFSRVAGTDVVTDLLVLRRRTEPLAAGERPLWIDTAKMALDDGDDSATPVRINAYFLEHPENILGTPAFGRGINGSPQLIVHGPVGDELAARMGARLNILIDDAVARGAGLTATAADLTVVDPKSFNAGLLTAADRGPDTPLYTLRYNESTKSIEYRTKHSWVPKKTAKTQIAETRRLIELRDAANSLIESESTGRPVSERNALRGHLNHLYDTYVAKYGPVNRFTWVIPKDITQEKHDEAMAKREAKWRAKEGEDGRPYRGPVPQRLLDEWDFKSWKAAEPYKVRRHLDGGMRYDPGWGVVSALEKFEEATGQAYKATIFSTDQLTAAREVTSAASPEEALALSMDRLQRVDLELVGELLDVDEDTARDLLGDLVWPSVHDADELIPASVALSGNVRDKLAAAEKAAATNPIYRDYVRALRAVMPEDRTAEQIRVRPGVPWIAPVMVAQFVRETFGVRSVTVDHVSGSWTVDVPKDKRGGRLMTETWGMDHTGCDAVSLLEAVCNSRSVSVTEKGVLDEKATFAAQAKATKISEEFARWAFADEARRDKLVAEYNRRFNSLRAPRYDGTHLRLPGLSDTFTPHPYQRDAVARIISEPTVLLDHVVGAGKTGSMVMGAYELKRLGLVKQPWIVVPNSIVEQVGREAKQWYPAANVLVGSGTTTAEGRRRFIAQTAASDWDMVIVPESGFTAIGVSDTLRADFIADQVSTLRQQLEGAQAPRTKKAIEKALKNSQERLEKMTAQDRKDTGLQFENSGADYLFVDEAHYYKNLQRISNIDELNCSDGSDRATDLALKLRILRDRRRDEGLAAGIPRHRIVERVACFATGTPIANSLGELWVMQTFLRPDLLEAAGVSELGDWGATFTASNTSVEMNATGTKLRPVTKVGKFTNLPELLALSAAFSDVVTRDQVPVKLPTLAGGQRQVVALKPSIEVVDFIADLGFRAEHLDAKNPRRDNILKIASDGRNVSLDPRMAGLDAPEHTRAAAVADRIMDVRRRHADKIYIDPLSGEPMAKPGCFQLAFCDRGTPKDGGGFNMYQAIKDELVARGVPAAEVRFVHEARKPSEITILREQCINGDVSVLIGSTEKMGTGWNVQARLAHLMHVDVPWRPADLEQREGRILRQGNQNDEVEISSFVTESSYDTVMWQKVEAKTLFVEQVRRNEVSDLEIEDLSGGDLGAAAAEAKALSTGDPRYLRQVQLDDEVRRLQALERAHHEATRRRDWVVSTHERTIPIKQRNLDSLIPVAERAAAAQSTPSIAIDGQRYSDRSVLAERLAAACRKAFAAGRDKGASEYMPLGATVDGVDVLAARDLTNDRLLLRLAVPSRVSDIKRDDLMATAGDQSGAKARGLLTRLDNMYADLPHHRATLAAELVRDQDELDDLLEHPPGPFDQVAELTDRQAELASLTLELRLASESAEAVAAREAAAERMNERGREPGWTLLLNPTPYLLEESGFLDAESLRDAVRQQERENALAYAEKQAAAAPPWIDLAAARDEVENLAAAGVRSPAAMYGALPAGSGDGRQRAAAAAVADSAQAVHCLQLGTGADKAGVVAALAAAAHNSKATAVLVPCSAESVNWAADQRLSLSRVTGADMDAQIADDEWAPSQGALVILDDADRLSPQTLRGAMAAAGETNSKLVMITGAMSEPTPGRALVAVLQENLPWAQALGERVQAAARTALSSAADSIGLAPDGPQAAQITEILSERDSLITEYTRLHSGTWRSANRDDGRDYGIEL